MREDPLLAVLSGKARVALDDLLIQVFLEAHPEAPQQIVLDLDTTDLPLEGHQERRFFHGYYDCYCYLPLCIFAGEHLLCARLRTADRDAAAGSKDEVARIVGRIRATWPAVRIIVREPSIQISSPSHRRSIDSKCASTVRDSTCLR